MKAICVDSKEYRSDSTMVDTVNLKYDYEFDANGNQVKGGVRQMLWDEENRLLAVSEGGFMSNYFYDCNGERTVKLSSGREALYVNASRAYNADSLPQKFVAYVSPYLVVSNGGQYTKHIYAGNQRIASKLGNIDDFGADPRRVDYAGADLKDINYDEKYKSEVKELETRYDSLGTDCTFRVVNDYVNGKSFCCDNNEIEIFNRPDTESGNSEDAGIFFYHPDHLGSTAMVTDHEGRITQNVVYIPFGEVFVEQRDGNWNTPYLFNAKELDEETGLYYYGARYLDPTGAQWLSVDPLFEKYAGMSPYNYCHDSPVTRRDPSGMNDYEIDSNGNLVRELYNKKSRFFIVKDGKRIKSLSFNENVVQRSGKQKGEVTRKVDGKKTITKVDYDLYQIYGEHNAKKVFEFLSNNTDVEWSKLTYGIDEHKDCLITTSHEHSAEGSMPALLTEGKYNKYNIYDIVHSHNEQYASFPSGIEVNQSGGDVAFAKWTRNKLKKSPNQDYVFRIYFAPEKFYIYYSENSKYEDFFDKEGHRLEY